MANLKGLGETAIQGPPSSQHSMSEGSAIRDERPCGLPLRLAGQSHLSVLWSCPHRKFRAGTARMEGSLSKRSGENRPPGVLLPPKATYLACSSLGAHFSRRLPGKDVSGQMDKASCSIRKL